MRVIFYRLILSFFLILPGTLWAQNQYWIQIEAQPNLNSAETRIRDLAGTLGDVAGFSLGFGWYDISLGTYSEDDANFTLRELRAAGRVPRDSFVTDGSDYRQQFWPVGANALTGTTITPETGAAPVEAEVVVEETATPEVENAQVETPEVTPTPTPVIEEPEIEEETPRQARRSEGLLTRDERKDLQIALQWEGFYRSSIDGAFGRGTRGAMAEYQRSMGYEPTGILTTRQREELLRNYNAVLASLGMERVSDERAGVSIIMPKALVEFDAYEYPFARFKPTNDSGVRVLMISQEGTEATLSGLYDIMQTLKIVPLEGERSRKKNSFFINGENSEISSYTYAALRRGEVKGFTLVWPQGDDKRRDRVIKEMQDSLEIIPGRVLEDSMIAGADTQQVDLLAGLELRVPEIVRSGFYVDNRGTVLTTSEVVGQCDRITIGEDYDADIVVRDDALGVALIRPRAPLEPIAHAQFQSGTPRLQSEVAVAGFTYGGVLGSPTITYGTLADIRGLAGETGTARLAMQVQPGDYGGPVFDGTGSVVGMLQTRKEDAGRRLPDDVSFATDAKSIGSLLGNNGVAMSRVTGGSSMAPEDLAGQASEMTVLVSCWG